MPKRRFCGRRIDAQLISSIEQRRVPFPSELLSGPSPWSSTTSTTETELEIGWDPAKTELHQALISSLWHLRNDTALLPVSIEGRVFINDQLVIARGAFTAGCTQLSGGPTNVGAYVINNKVEGGKNRFRLEMLASAHLLTVGLDGINVNVQLEFTGERPEIKPPEPEWLTYLKWGALGLGILGAVYVGVRVYEARKKK